MKSPYVPFFTSDFLAGTSGMTAATKGVYITLLCLMYEKESPLPQKWEILARRCGCTLPAFKKAIEALEDDGKMTVSEDGLWSKTCDKHVALRRERTNSASAAAKKRWEKEQQKQWQDDKTAMREACQPKPKPEPEPKEGVNPLTPFSEFWAKWPNKTAKKNAEVAWKKLSQPDREVILSLPSAGFEAWRRQCPNANPIHPASFLNGRRWEDEPMKGTVNGTTPNDSGADVARRAAERWAARRMDSGPGANASQPLLSARQSDGRSGSGNR